MPGPDGAGGGRALTDDELDQLVVRPVQSLAHDAAWFADVARAKPHAALLRGLPPASDPRVSAPGVSIPDGAPKPPERENLGSGTSVSGGRGGRRS